MTARNFVSICVKAPFFTCAPGFHLTYRKKDSMTVLLQRNKSSGTARMIRTAANMALNTTTDKTVDCLCTPRAKTTKTKKD
jgi:hypothetical protein